MFIPGVTKHFRSRWPEWALALLLLAQSIDTLLNADKNPSDLYKVITHLMNIRHPAMAGVVIAGSWMIALFLNGTLFSFRRASPWLRAGCGTLAAVYWTVWSVATWLATPNTFSMAWTNYAWFAAMAGTCVLLSAREVAHADEKAARWTPKQASTSGQ